MNKMLVVTAASLLVYAYGCVTPPPPDGVFEERFTKLDSSGNSLDPMHDRIT